MTVRLWLVFGGVILIIFSVAMVSGQKNHYEETIDPDEYWFEEYVIPDEALVPFKAEIEVLHGPVANAFLVNEENFNLYTDGKDFYPYRGVIEEGTSKIELEHLFTSKGLYFMVVDNGDLASGEEAESASRVSITTILNFDTEPQRPLREGEFFISPDEWLIESWEVGRGMGNARLSVEIFVVEGPPINMYLVDNDNYELSQRDEHFASYRSYQATEVTRLSESYELGEPGDYYFLLDNADRHGTFAMEGSIITYSATSEPVEIPAPGFMIVGMVMCLITVTRIGFVRAKSLVGQ